MASATTPTVNTPSPSDPPTVCEVVGGAVTPPAETPPARRRRSPQSQSTDDGDEGTKKGYHNCNIFTMDQLHSILDESDCVTVLRAKEEDFFDYGKFFNLFYSDLKNQIKQNHIFHCGDGSTVANQITMDLRRSGLDEDAAVKHKMIKRSFPTRGDYESTAAGHQLAVANRGQDILRLMETTLEPLKAPGINIYKKVELYTKYLLGGIVPLEFRDDQLYQQPTDEEIRAVNEERKERKIFRDEINEKKSNRVLKDKIMQAVMM